MMNVTGELVAENKVKELFRRLFAETDQAQRESCRRLLLTQLKRYSSKEKQLNALERWLGTCDAEIFRHRIVMRHLKAKGGDIRQAKIKLENLLDVQVALRTQLLISLPSSNRPGA